MSTTWRSPTAVYACITIGIITAVIMTAWAWALAPAAILSAEAHDTMRLKPVIQAIVGLGVGCTAAWMAAHAATRRGAWTSCGIALGLVVLSGLQMAAMHGRIGAPWAWSPITIREAVTAAVRDGTATSPSLIQHMLPSTDVPRL